MRKEDADLGYRYGSLLGKVKPPQESCGSRAQLSGTLSNPPVFHSDSTRTWSWSYSTAHIGTKEGFQPTLIGG